jgi:diguanylate cyclase (GGDEF)-like protein
MRLAALAGLQAYRRDQVLPEDWPALRDLILACLADRRISVANRATIVLHALARPGDGPAILAAARAVAVDRQDLDMAEDLLALVLVLEGIGADDEVLEVLPMPGVMAAAARQPASGPYLANWHALGQRPTTEKPAHIGLIPASYMPNLDTDGLTGLADRYGFDEALRTRIEAGEPFGVIVADLDRFKLVNDTYGHLAGNVLLRGVAFGISGLAPDHRAFRYGGDEFAVLVLDADGTLVRSLAERIRATVAAMDPRVLLSRIDLPPQDRPDLTSLTVSVGVASWPADGATADELILAANRAMFLAKRDGGNRVETDPPLT